jgi:AraC-like DNA-binding protein
MAGPGRVATRRPPTGQFSHAFRQTTGLRRMRGSCVDALRTQLLRNAKWSLSEAALACEFADQSRLRKCLPSFRGLVLTRANVFIAN